MEENQTDICTDNCASLHRLLCILIKDVDLKIQKMKVNFEKNKKSGWPLLRPSAF
jgi:hypothetical protein